KRRAPQNPLFLGLSAFIVILLITSASFNTPLFFIPVNESESMPLNFSMVGIPLLGLLMLVVIYMRLKK
ncbi:MAG: hypothetical protein QXD77_02675, partial [Candidatus Aenigmatarchaeota archaeon]